ICLFVVCFVFFFFFCFSSRRRHTRFDCDWSSDVCSSDLLPDFICWRTMWVEMDLWLDRREIHQFLLRRYQRRVARHASLAAIMRSEERRVGKECRYGGWRES